MTQHHQPEYNSGYYSGYYPAYAPPRRRRRRWPWVLLVIVLVLAGLFVAADRIALKVAEGQAATTLQNSQHLSQKPDVDIAGFPFLTQLAAGEFDKVTITADDVVVGSGPTLQIDSVVADLHHVTVPRDLSQVRARTGTAVARISYTELSRVLGTPVHAGSDGRLVAEPSVTVAGQTVRATVSARVQASATDGITFTDPEVTVASLTLPSSVSNAAAGVFGKAISLAKLPFDVEVTGVDVTDTALVLHLSGQNLVYSRS
ncbi:MAG TPA: DUF2993 domain-containing protein [Jatrophihabitantaceae bacterium]